MRIAFINAVPYGSTGRIVRQLRDYCEKKGDETAVFFSWSKKKHKTNTDIRRNIYVSSFLGKTAHIIASRIVGHVGCFSYFDTIKIIRKLKKFKPDIVHLNLLHAWSFNFEILFRYLKMQNIPVVWTMHDCWAITGHCAHFSMAKCDKWRTGCGDCPIYHEYPKSIIDDSKSMWKKKKEAFVSLKNMIIVTPSEWLAKIMQASFLNSYPVKVINNGIDLSIFKPTESDFKAKYSLDDDVKIVLGVSFDWGKKKGLDVFIELSKRLDKKYKVVLVGIDNNVDMDIPANILKIAKTNSQEELAKIYSVADVFFNPTREEVLGLVNIEALACGTPVITFNSGGSPECIDESCGVVVNCEDIDCIKKTIEKVCNDKYYSSEKCVQRAQKFDGKLIYEKYYSVYDEVLKKCLSL